MKRYTKHFAVFVLILTLTGCMGGCESMSRTELTEATSCDCTASSNLVKSILSVPATIDDSFRIPNFGTLLNPSASAAAASGELGPVSWLVQVISTSMGGNTTTSGGAQAVYEGLNGAGFGWQTVLSSMIVLSIMFFGAAIAMGMVQANPYTVVLYIIKVMAVYYLATDWTVFFDFVVKAVEGLVEGLSAVMAATFAGPAGEPDNLFENVDRILFMYLTGDYWKVLAASASMGFSGFVYSFGLLAVIVTYVWGVVGALKVYIIAIIARHLMYAVAPIYLTFLLFEKTKSLFDAWIEQIVNFTLQPIFLFAFFGMFNQMILNFLGNIAGADASVCLLPYLPLGMSFGFETWQFSVGGSPVTGADAVVPLDWWALMSLLVLSKLMGDMGNWVVELASRMSGGLVSGNVAISGWDGLKQKMSASASSRGSKYVGGSVNALASTLVGARDKDGRRRMGTEGFKQGWKNSARSASEKRRAADNEFRSQMGIGGQKTEAQWTKENGSGTNLFKSAPQGTGSRSSGGGDTKRVAADTAQGGATGAAEGFVTGGKSGAVVGAEKGAAKAAVKSYRDGDGEKDR
jgi:type IV secretory pathway VirB6-like protein